MSARNKMLSLVLAAGIALIPQVAQAATTLTIYATGTTTPVTSIAPGDILDVSSSGPILTDGSTEQSVYADWSKQSLKLKDTTSIVKPEGWTLEYTTDGTVWSTTAPADLKTVVGIRSVGDVTSLGSSKFQTSSAGEAVASSGSFNAGASGGDGMDVTFAGDNVINVFHHLTKIEVSCHVKSTGESCFGADASKVISSSYGTGNASMAYWDATDSKLFVQASNNASDVGIVCVDMSTITTPALCTTPFTKLGTGVANDLGMSAKVGSKIYIPNATTAKMMCFNMATDSACADWTTFTTLPSDGAPTGAQVTMYGRAAAMGGKVYFSLKGKIGCYDPATDALCGSSTGTAISGGFANSPQFTMFPVRDSSGTLLGMCLYSSRQCLNSAGEVVSPSPIPAALTTWMNSHSVPLWNTYNAGNSAELDNRIYLPVGPLSTAGNNVFCFDYTTGAACSGFGTNGIASNVGTQIYVFQTDPVLSDCIWTNGNAGEITNFDAFTGVKGCVFETRKVNMPYTATVPRMSCDEANRVTQWDKAIFNVPTGITTSDLRITILKEDGTAVAGWSDKTVDANGELDMSTLSTSDTGTKPTIQANAGNVGGRAIYNLTADIKYTAGNPEICFKLVAAENCPDLTTHVSGAIADGLVASTVISTPTTGSAQIDKSSATLAGSNTTATCTPTIQEVNLPNSGTDPASPDPSTATDPTAGSTSAAGAVSTKKANGLAATGAAGTTLGLEFILGYYLLRRGSHLATAENSSDDQ